ncbi:MAG: hypothetical protein MUF73_05560 [Rhodobacteraceae bacterium]|jgi:hypothetical protein|nr:hypothetical protein [Paracoccaceae bacterium]
MSRSIRNLRPGPPDRAATEVAPAAPGAPPSGASLVARAVLRVRLRHVIEDAGVAQAVAAALAARAATRGSAVPR